MTERDEPYVLDVDEAADAYADLMVVRLGAPRAESIATFRRMIEAVRQEERAKALREAADAVLHNAADPAYAGDPDEYARGYRRGIRDAARALRRAAEKGDDRDHR